jgi:pimeloyl-ACP methyl ester carboxylesterase
MLQWYKYRRMLKVEVVNMKLLSLLAMTSLIVLLFTASTQAQDTDGTPTPSGLEGSVVKTVSANNIEVVYETFGSEDRQPILFIAGTGQQLIEWPPDLIDALVERGYYVVIYDNRDVGLSTKLDEAGPPDWVAIFTALEAGEPLLVAYSADDMAQDAIGLLDALNIEQAHILGASGGSIIAQVLAAEYPERVLSLTLLMANSGNPAYPLPADPEQIAIVPPPLPIGSPTEDIVEQRILSAQALSSPDYPTDETVLRDRISQAVERSYYPVGADRQSAAVLAVLPDMAVLLETIEAPTVVIHGDADPLIPYQLGEDVASKIPNAEFILIEGMGHEIPVQLVPMIADAITNVTSF